jgi:Septum formation
VAIAALATLLGVLAACGSAPTPAEADPDQVDSVETPELGACRLLTLDDVGLPTNATRTVECTQKHTAQTYAVGELPDELDDAAYDSKESGAFAYETCSTKLRKFLGADESLSMRTVLSWAWFRPSQKAWDDGARWYRCDVVGGGEQSAALVPLPDTAEGLLVGRPDDRWMVCVAGETVNGSAKIPCTQKHDWRAVTTIKLGEPDDSYPGDRLSEVQTRDYCSRSVQAWLNYPVEFDYGYTWFHEAEWDAGNRRSVCWAKTTE